MTSTTLNSTTLKPTGTAAEQSDATIDSPAKKSRRSSTTAKRTERRSMTAPLRAVLALPAFALAGYLMWLAFTNIAYPLRPAMGLPGYTRGSWGGPTYAGVWAVHGVAGLAMLAAAYFILLPILRPIVHPLIQRRAR